MIGKINHEISGPSASDNQLETEYSIHSLMMGDKRRTDKLEQFYLAECSNIPVGQFLKDLEIPPYNLN